MTPQDLLKELHVFARADFLGEEECRLLREQATPGQRSAATRYERDTINNAVNARTFTASVEPAAAERLNERFGLLKPRLEQHFDLALQAWDPPTIFIYEQGAVLKPHRDVYPDNQGEQPETVRRRKVSAVVFLNTASESSCPDEFRGGHLRLYKQEAAEGGTPQGVGIRARRGLLVAFEATLPHEVTKVTRGTRYCAITWFY